MRAVVIPSYGPLSQLTVADIPTPQPKSGEARVRVHAAAISPADYKVAMGKVKFLHGRSFPMALGYDFSGVIDLAGPEAAGFVQGEEVFGFLPYGPGNNQGSFAEMVTVRTDSIARKPAGISHLTAAAAATAGLTSLQALRDHGRLAPGGRVLVFGASGGVGSVALGIARRLGANVTAVVGAHAVEFVRALGADSVIDHGKEDPLAAAQGSVDVFFDAAAASSFTAAKRVLGPRGTYVSTLPSGRLVQGFLASLFSSRRCRLVMVRARRADLELIGRWLSDGLNVPLDSTVPVRDVRRGIERMLAGKMHGRVAVDVIGGF